MTEAEQALADAEASKERVEQMRQEIQSNLETLRQVADELRELTRPRVLTT